MTILIVAISSTKIYTHDAMVIIHPNGRIMLWHKLSVCLSVRSLANSS